MKRLKVTRIWQCQWGMFSRWTYLHHSWWGVERRKDDLAKPAIPAGIFKATLGIFYGGDGPGGKADYPAYILRNVPGQPEDLCKLHRANFFDQLKGCLAPGKNVDWFTDVSKLGVTSSALALREFMDAFGGDQEIEVEIVEQL